MKNKGIKRVTIINMINDAIRMERTKISSESPLQSFCQKCGGIENMAIELRRLCNLIDPKGETDIIDPLNPINTIQNAGMVIKYLLLDLESTRRENLLIQDQVLTLQKRLKKRPIDPLESPDGS